MLVPHREPREGQSAGNGRWREVSCLRAIAELAALVLSPAVGRTTDAEPAGDILDFGDGEALESSPPSTVTGVGFTSDVSLFPSWPFPLYPQQYAVPFSVSAQVCAPDTTKFSLGLPLAATLTVTAIVACWAIAPGAVALTTIG